MHNCIHVHVYTIHVHTCTLYMYCTFVYIIHVLHLFHAFLASGGEKDGYMLTLELLVDLASSSDNLIAK